MPPLDQKEIAPGIYYVNHPHHRDATNHDKSQWTITGDEEEATFSRTVNQGWYKQSTGWGLHLPNGDPEYLGISRRAGPLNTARRLFIAKFVQDPNRPCWHGYPADHQRHASNVPPDTLLRTWCEANLLRWAVMSKIMKG